MADNLPTVKEEMKNQAIRLHGKTEDHPNPLIRALGDYDEDAQLRYNMPRMLLKY